MGYLFLPKVSLSMKKIKNLKISNDIHIILKTYCDKKGLKIYKFLEKLIVENCKESEEPKRKKDIYGE